MSTNLYPGLGQQLYQGTGANAPEPTYPLVETLEENDYSTSVAVNPHFNTVVTVVYEGTATTEPTVQLSVDPTFVNYEDVDTIPASSTGMSTWVCSIPLMGLLRIKNTSDADILKAYVQGVATNFG